jgi:hypothetical protein
MGFDDVPVSVTVELELDIKDKTEPIEKEGVMPFIPLLPFSNPKFKMGLLVVPVIDAVLDVPDDNDDTDPIDNDGVKPV